ncbi:MAG: glycosyltransferase family 4 protein [Candidatus Omnitrophica bacterium]|nr:glycosyltransferase family 4 protein [Candidatus Omnitrophota bacterium]
MKAQILLLANNLGIGGSERSLQLYATHLDRRLFDVRVCGIFQEGSRGILLRHNGIPVHSALGDPDAVGRLVEKHQVQLIHLFRSGYYEPHWDRVIHACLGRGARSVVETNVFGFVDKGSSDSFIDLHLHPSKSSYLRFYREAMACRYPRLNRHHVLYYPVDPLTFHPPSGESRQRARAQLGLGQGACILLHVARPDVRRWSDLLLEALPAIFRLVPEAQMVFMTLPDSRRRWLQKQPFADRCLVLPTTADDLRLAEVYAASDIFLHAARKGESFGLAIAEAMASGIPVVTASAPWGPNAQIELVDHLETGIVANTPEAFSDAVVHLAHHPDERRRMGLAGRQKVERLYGAPRQGRILTRCYLELLAQKGIELDSPLQPSTEAGVSMEELVAYGQEYQKRLAASWDGAGPARQRIFDRSFFSRARWFLLDACETMWIRWKEKN